MEIDNINRETERPIHFPVKDNGRFKIANQKDFEKIPGWNIGYWLSDQILNIFSSNKSLKDVGDGKQGLATADNARFLRLWQEVSTRNYYLNANSSKRAIESGCKWFPYNKAGELRRWYGNQDYMVNWENGGYEIKNIFGDNGKLRSRPQNTDFYFRESISWGLITSAGSSFRLYPDGFIYDVAGMSYFPNGINKYVLLGSLNTKLISNINKVLNPTINLQIGDVIRLPFLDIKSEIVEILVKQCVDISRNDWNSREISWYFQINNLIRLKESTLEKTFDEYTCYWKNQFNKLHQNEEELNRQFIEIYGLQDELTPDVPLEEITILQEETSIKDGELVFHADEVFAQFVSYAVGCMFGRYSLDKEGLILANQGETLQDYLEKVGKKEEELTFVPDRDNIIPVLDDEWFRDDIVERFHTFLKASFGEQNFRKNLDFVEECLGKDIRRYFTRDFYKDHIRRYKKRPIYWMFSSPKGYFNVLVYLHRYTPDTINRILNSYLKEFIEKLKMYRSQQEHIEVEGSVTEQNKARKEIDRINVMLEDCMQYETEILYPLATERITLDLDDGVLVNYNKLGSAVAKVDGLNDKKTKEKVRKFDWIDTSQIRD